MENSVCWIDPLDSTISYVKGELDAVTSLIGLTINSKPVVGIISQPYTRNNVYNPKIYYGFSDLKEVFYIYGN